MLKISKTILKKKKFFIENGVVVFKKIIPRKIINECLNELSKFKDITIVKNSDDVVIDSYKSKKYIKYFQFLNFYMNSFNKILNLKIFEISSFLLGEQTYFLNMGYHNKIPGGSETPPHQDNFYWCRAYPKKALTAYVALNSQSKINGGITYYLKSHKLKTLQHESSNVKAFSSFLNQKTIIDNKIHLKKIFSPVLEPGDIVFHHCNIIHKAEKNNHRTAERKALALTMYSINSKTDTNLHKKYLKNRNKYSKYN